MPSDMSPERRAEMTPLNLPTELRSVTYRTADHEFFLSFNTDDQAAHFHEWWANKGRDAFMKYHQKRKEQER